jgi:phosphatidyl-myo-inositol dimannoside synthase
MNRSVLFLTLRIFSATGGIEKVCRVFSKALSDIGVRNKVFSVYDKQGDVVNKYIDPSAFKGFNASKLRFFANTLWQASSYDIIVMSHINLLSVGYILKLVFPGKKLVLFAHGIEVWGNIGGMRKRMLNNCDTILSVSNFTRNKLIENVGLEEKKILVLNNCLDPFLDTPEKNKNEVFLKKYGLNKGDIVLLTLTRLSSKELYKGYDHVLLSINTLKEKYPSIKYLIVGRYDDNEKQRLDNIILNNHLEEYVIFTGYIPDEELAAHYSLADIYIMPSKKEGFGIVFIEAMYYGLPVIAGNKDGSADALANGKLGLLVDPDNQQQINDTIEKVILHKDEYKPNKELLNKYFSYDYYKENCKGVLAKH